MLNNVRIIAVFLALTFSGAPSSAQSRPQCVNDPTHTLAQLLQSKTAYLGFTKIPSNITIVSGEVRVRIDYPVLTLLLPQRNAYHSLGLRPPYVDIATCSVRDQAGTLWFVFTMKDGTLLYVDSAAGTVMPNS